MEELRGLDDTTTNESSELPWWRSPLNVSLAALLLLVAGFALGTFVPRGDDPTVHNSVDTGFLQDMRIHHEQAVNMSLIYLDVSAKGMGDGSESRGTLRLIAREIIVNQSNESGRMVQMLRQFGAAETNETDQVMGWMGEPTPLDKMPGLASDAELKTLQESRGAAADKMFGELMIAHHKGGIHMAEHVSMHGSNDEVTTLAAAMVKAQTGEIAEMEKLLAAIG